MAGRNLFRPLTIIRRFVTVQHVIGHTAVPLHHKETNSTHHIGHKAIPVTKVHEQSSAHTGVTKVPTNEVIGMKPEIVALLTARGIQTLFPVQASAFMPIYQGKDAIARSRTGTGKTMAFLLPLIQRVFEDVKRPAARTCTVLILEPTRELARQVGEELNKLSQRISAAIVHGGASFGHQELSIRPGVDFLVATPGRLIDLLERRAVNLQEVRTVVLDEADEMLKIGFEEALNKILETVPMNSQTLLFSATMPAWVATVSKQRLKKPVQIDASTGSEQTPSAISHLALCTEDRLAGIRHLILKFAKNGRTIVFCKTKAECNKLATVLRGSRAIHGDCSQNDRDGALRDFKAGVLNILVATDVAARGLDIPDVQLVVQLGAPDNVEHYVHRAGRTARAGKSGVCALVVPPEQRPLLRGLMKQIGKPIEPVYMSGTSNPATLLQEAMSLGKGTPTPQLLQTAQAFLEARGAQGVGMLLSRLLVEAQPRSLLTGTANFTTAVVRDCRDLEELRGVLGQHMQHAVFYEFYREEDRSMSVAVDVAASAIPAVQVIPGVSVPTELSPRILTHGVSEASIVEGERSEKRGGGRGGRDLGGRAGGGFSNRRY